MYRINVTIRVPNEEDSKEDLFVSSIEEFYNRLDKIKKVYSEKEFEEFHTPVSEPIISIELWQSYPSVPNRNRRTHFYYFPYERKIIEIIKNRKFLDFE